MKHATPRKTRAERLTEVVFSSLLCAAFGIFFGIALGVAIIGG